MKIVSLLIAISVGFIFSGCGGKYLNSNISVYHKLDPVWKKVPYVFEKARNQNGLEDEAFFQKLEERLRNNQFVLAKNLNDAKYRIRFKYEIDNGTSVPYTYSYPVYGQTGGGTAYSSGTVSSYGSTARYSGTTRTAATYGVVGSGVSSGVNTVFKRKLTIEIYDAKENNQRYIAKVTSNGSSPAISPVMDEMLDTLFREFPGNNQQSRYEEIEFHH